MFAHPRSNVAIVIVLAACGSAPARETAASPEPAATQEGCLAGCAHLRSSMAENCARGLPCDELCAAETEASLRTGCAAQGAEFWRCTAASTSTTQCGAEAHAHHECARATQADACSRWCYACEDHDSCPGRCALSAAQGRITGCEAELDRFHTCRQANQCGGCGEESRALNECQMRFCTAQPDRCPLSPCG